MGKGCLDRPASTGTLRATAKGLYHDAWGRLDLDARGQPRPGRPTDYRSRAADGARFLARGGPPESEGTEAPWFATADLQDMAEVYAMALLRDVPLDLVSACSTACGRALVSPCDVALALGAVGPGLGIECETISAAMFRGPWPGAHAGPFVSQFLLVGDADHCASGQIHTAQGTVLQARLGPLPVDYLQDWWSWRDVQNGADTRALAVPAPARRFPTTARDLAGLVRPGAASVEHVLRAVSWGLDSRGAPWSPGLWIEGPGVAGALAWRVADRVGAEARHLVRRLIAWPSPEQIGGVITRVANGRAMDLDTATRAMAETLTQSRLVPWIALQAARALVAPSHPIAGRGNPGAPWCSCLVPQAYPEGAPPWSGYGVTLGAMVGAGVTVLKALYDLFDAPGSWDLKGLRAIRLREIYAPSEHGHHLTTVFSETDLTLAGEFDKLAANLGLAPAMAGIAGRSECLAGMRLGERMALAALPDLLGPSMPVLRLVSFDGTPICLAP